MKLFGFRINAGEIKDVREIEKTLENIEEKKNKIIEINPTCAEAQVGYVYSLRLALILALVAVLLRTILS